MKKIITQWMRAGLLLACSKANASTHHGAPLSMNKADVQHLIIAAQISPARERVWFQQSLLKSMARTNRLLAHIAKQNAALLQQRNHNAGLYCQLSDVQSGYSNDTFNPFFLTAGE